MPPLSHSELFALDLDTDLPGVDGHNDGDGDATRSPSENKRFKMIKEGAMLVLR